MRALALESARTRADIRVMAARTEHRPRRETAHWAGAAATGCAVLFLATGDASFLFPGALFLALVMQCGQRIVVEQGVAQRVGLRPVVLDLHSATMVHGGRAWWVELFLCGRPLQLRDADGRRLYLESWLWSRETRAALLAAVPDGSRPPAHS